MKYISMKIDPKGSTPVSAQINCEHKRAHSHGNGHIPVRLCKQAGRYMTTRYSPER